MTEYHDQHERNFEHAAALHPDPLTTGLDITEKDKGLQRLYMDVQKSQLTQAALEGLPEDHLLWLAGHLEKPLVIEPAHWEKLRANAWRARVIVERKTQDRASEAQLAFQRDENKLNRRAQWRAALLAGLFTLAGVGIGLFGSWVFRDSSPTQPFRVEVVNPTTTTSTP